MIELICGDSMKILPDLFQKTKGFDMIFLDPPFTEWHASDIGRYNVNGLSYCVNRLLKLNGVVWLWGYTPQLISNWGYWNRWFKCISDMVRIKPAGHPPPTNVQYPVRAHENIWCLIKKKAKVTDTKLMMRRKSKVIKIKDKSGDAMRANGRKKTHKVYKVPVWIKSYYGHSSIGKHSKEYFGHPTQKPIKMVRILIEASTDVNDWILDPFAGSCVTLQAAQELYRNCLGIEISPEYCKMKRRRLERVRVMTKLSKFIKLTP